MNDSPANFYVYVHSRLHTGEPFYVGKGCAHRWASRHTRTAHWRNIVAKDGGFHNSFIARNINEELAFLIEIEAIDKYKRLGVRLSNASNGGEGPSGMKLSEDTKKKLSAINTGKKHSAETRAKMSASHKGLASKWMKGRSPSAATRAKLSVAGMGRIPTEETRAKLSAANKGTKPSVLAIARGIEVNTGKHSSRKGKPGKKHSDETRRKMSESHKTRLAVSPPSKQTGEKIRVAQLARWARIKAMSV